MAPKSLIYILVIAATSLTTATAAALPEPMPFSIPADVEILDLRTEADKASGAIVSS
jgi:hypothetical protein